MRNGTHAAQPPLGTGDGVHVGARPTVAGAATGVVIPILAAPVEPEGQTPAAESTRRLG